jgi:pantothenate synthetase
MTNLKITASHIMEQSEALAESSRNLRITTDELRDRLNNLVSFKYEKRRLAIEEGQFQ